MNSLIIKHYYKTGDDTGKILVSNGVKRKATFNGNLHTPHT
jgi:hypothetical protein